MKEQMKEKFEAWFEREYNHLESSKYTDAVPHIKYGFWMSFQAGGAELVEALEKAQQRICELEAKLATPVRLPKTNGYWTESEKAYEEAITLAKRQIRLAGFQCEGDE